MKNTIERLLWAGAVYAGVLLINAILMSFSVALSVALFWVAFVCLVIQGARLIINGGRHWKWKEQKMNYGGSHRK